MAAPSDIEFPLEGKIHEQKRPPFVVIVPAQELAYFGNLIPPGVPVLGIEAICDGRPIWRTRPTEGLDSEVEPRLCLALLTMRSEAVPLLRSTKDLLLARGMPDIPSPCYLGVAQDERLVLEMVLASLADLVKMLSETCIRQLGDICELRRVYEAVSTEKAGLVEAIGLGRAGQKTLVFSNEDNAKANRIRLRAGDLLQQCLPVSSRAFSALELKLRACAAGVEINVALLRDGEAVAVWRFTPGDADRWTMLGLPLALSGARTALAVTLQTNGDAEVLLGAFEPSPSGRALDRHTGEVIAPHALAMRIWNAAPGSPVVHETGCILPN